MSEIRPSVSCIAELRKAWDEIERLEKDSKMTPEKMWALTYVACIEFEGKRQIYDENNASRVWGVQDTCARADIARAHFEMEIEERTEEEKQSIFEAAMERLFPVRK